MKTIVQDLVVYYIGQNSRENDNLFSKMPKTAIWFHLESGPSAHVYAVKPIPLDKNEIKRGAMLVREHSHGQGKVIYLKKTSLNLIGQGELELLRPSKYA